MGLSRAPGWQPKAGAPRGQKGSRHTAASCCCRQALPACLRCLHGTDLGSPSPHCKAGASRLGGGAWSALEPGKHLALCWCDWSYLLIPCRTPSPSQSRNALQAGGTRLPCAPPSTHPCPRQPRWLVAAGHTGRGCPRAKCWQSSWCSPRVPDGQRGLMGVYIHVGLGRGHRAHNLWVLKLLLCFTVVPEAATAPRHVIA